MQLLLAKTKDYLLQTCNNYMQKLRLTDVRVEDCLDIIYKNGIFFIDENMGYCFIVAPNIDHGYTLEPPH